jgi:hypothetical protein
MKDLGEADVILDIKLVIEGNGGVTLSQSHYVEKNLSHFGYSDFKPAPTPYDVSMNLKKEQKDNERSAKIFSNNWFFDVLS